MEEEWTTYSLGESLNRELADFLSAVIWKLGDTSIDDSAVEIHSVKLSVDEFYRVSFKSIEVRRDYDGVTIIIRK